jgi:hypothetical protein
VEVSTAKTQEDDLGCRQEAVALMLPQFVHHLLSILVGAFHEGASPKKGKDMPERREYQICPSGGSIGRRFGVDSESASDLSCRIGVSETAEYWEKV